MRHRERTGRWPETRSHAAVAIRGRGLRGPGRVHLPRARVVDAAGGLVLMFHHRVRRVGSR